MRFHVTLMLPGRNGQSTQFVICDAPVGSIEEFTELLNSEDHLLVTEMNSDPITRQLVPGDGVIINQQYVAKVSPYRERSR